MSEESNPGGHDFVRPFIMTGGRTEVTGTKLRFETLVQARRVKVPATVPFEQRDLLARSRQPVSVAELAARADLVVGVACVLLNDLLDAGLVEVFASDPDTIDLDTLTAMVAKIRSL